MTDPQLEPLTKALILMAGGMTDRPDPGDYHEGLPTPAEFAAAILAHLPESGEVAKWRDDVAVLEDTLRTVELHVGEVAKWRALAEGLAAALEAVAEDDSPLCWCEDVVRGMHTSYCREARAALAAYREATK